MNNIALRTLDEKQSVALCLVNLAKSYEHKYNNKTDEFLLQCAELALKHDPKNLNALLLKQQVLDARVIEYARENKLNSIEKLRKDKNINNQLEQLENHLALLSELGYIQMPVDMQEVVLNGFKGENTAQFIQKNKNPNPFTSIDVPEEENQYLSLSHGIFQEVFEPKEIEIYGHFTFNTKNSELIKIDTQNVNNQVIDPVAFAYDLGARMYDARLGRMISMDPLTKSFPSMSPYSFAGNNPILQVDEYGEAPKIAWAKYNYYGKGGVLMQLSNGDYVYSRVQAACTMCNEAEVVNYKFNKTSGEWEKYNPEFDCLSCDINYLIGAALKFGGRYLTPVEDIVILVDGKDFDGNESSRVAAATFLIIGVVPGGKALRPLAALSKGAKFAKIGNFASKTLLDEHFLKHASEFGSKFKNADEYLKGAQNFFKRESEEILQFTRKNGDVVRYDKANNIFGVAKGDGTIKTFFKPDEGLNYFKKEFSGEYGEQAAKAVDEI